MKITYVWSMRLSPQPRVGVRGGLQASNLGFLTMLSPSVRNAKGPTRSGLESGHSPRVRLSLLANSPIDRQITGVIPGDPGLRREN